ncbi:hypothetical protein [Rhizobium laguerreae]|uniref:hypothetical protein n=1 Tax=Rhizobium laguerreae TaxID=1076926 RepID=UPI001441917A|nr:hypothetical protein [Rhizobium laguerreae]NKM35914.1 hypothetical protein [Rhizobium laguerreae]
MQDPEGAIRCDSPFDLPSSTSGMLHPVRRPQPAGARIFPAALRLLAGAKFRGRLALHLRFGLSGAPLLVRHAAHPRDVRISKGENTVQQLAQFLTATGRRLRVLGKVICHFFRKGKLGLKLAIKIPFFVEIEASFETDWNRRE